MNENEEEKKLNQIFRQLKKISFFHFCCQEWNNKIGRSAYDRPFWENETYYIPRTRHYAVDDMKKKQSNMIRFYSHTHTHQHGKSYVHHNVLQWLVQASMGCRLTVRECTDRMCIRGMNEYPLENK